MALESNGIKINPDAVVFEGKSLTALQYNGIEVWRKRQGDEAYVKVSPKRIYLTKTNNYQAEVIIESNTQWSVR